MERADAVAAAVLDQVQLAHDALLFAIAVQTLSRGYHLRGIELQCHSANRGHSRPDAREVCDLEAVEERLGELDLTWLEDGLSECDRFLAFRALDSDKKGKIAAWCLGAVLVPNLASSDDDSFVQAVAAMALPDVRDRWTPRFANVWDRVRKPYMLHVLEQIGLGDDAAAMSTARKGALAKHMETLFARPFKTLTKAQRAAVEAWTPEGMATVQPAADDEQETVSKAAA